MNFTLGSFIHRKIIESNGSLLDSISAYYRSVWDLVTHGPEVVQPKRCGNTEPLKKIQDVDLSEILTDDYIISNGRKCLGMVNRPGFRDSEFYRINLLLEFKKEQAYKADEIYFWLRDNTKFTYVYKATRKDELMQTHLAFHQMINTGVTELDLNKVMTMRDLFDRFETTR